MTLSTEELKKLKKDLNSARENTELRRTKFKSSKTKSTQKPFWKSVLDFLTK